MEQPEIKTYTRDEIINGNADDYNKFYPRALVDMAIRSILENCSRAIRRCSEMQNELCTAYEVRAYKYQHCIDKATIKHQASVLWMQDAQQYEPGTDKYNSSRQKSDRYYRHSKKWLEIANRFKEEKDYNGKEMDTPENNLHPLRLLRTAETDSIAGQGN